MEQRYVFGPGDPGRSAESVGVGFSFPANRDGILILSYFEINS